MYLSIQAPANQRGNAATPAKYDIRLRFPSLKADAEVTLALSKREMTASAGKGEAEYTFESVLIDKGELRLLATLTTGTETKGPWQVDVFLK